ncbi:MAG: bifunctional DNA primase/helicase, partial [Scytonematopsis contorta HA4267-MV1]|nr:bifunctional DNA primase/helicase [Scytonematopsis contorta HA4267-MV1]
PDTGNVYPLPPKIVADRDLAERRNLPLCMDWGNYSASWLARHILGLPGILKRLVNGEKVTATDSDLVKMTEIALKYATHIKAILGFTVPNDCQPIWLLGTLLNHFGLKQIDHKEGPKGKQVKYYSLCEKELDFARQVIAYRKQKHDLYEERARLLAEEQARHQAFLAIQYRDRSKDEPVSTPPTNGMENPIGEGVDTKGKEPEPPSEPQIGDDLEPLDGDPTPIDTCVEQLREGIKQGVETVKALFKSWGENRRWCAVFRLEKIAEKEMHSLTQMIPDFYTWMGEPFSST